MSEPDYFHDFGLDQVRDAVLAGREEYDLAPLFHAPLEDVEAVRRRQDAVRDLEREPVAAAVRAFGQGMSTVRKRLTQSAELRQSQQRQTWLLDAVRAYCAAAGALRDALAALQLESAELRELRDHLAHLTAAEAFAALAAEVAEVHDALAAIEYTVRIRDSRVTVDRCTGEGDYGAEVLATFAKFRQGDVKDYRLVVADEPRMSHVEEQVIDRVVQLFPDAFGALERFCARHDQDAFDARLLAFDREVQLLLAYLEHIAPLRDAGLPFAYPDVAERVEKVEAEGAFDLALAASTTPVLNDLRFTAPARILVVTGPNQGGKTTFARTVGQLHHLAALGLPVPARGARLLLPDRIYAHFEREEDLATLSGKLEEELERMHGILDRITDRSLVVMNESFSSTTLEDTRRLGAAILRRIGQQGALCVYVTFVDELAALDEMTVSMVAEVDAEDPTVRTFKIARRPADGLAYAAALADRHGLSSAALRKRLVQ